MFLIPSIYEEAEERGVCEQPSHLLGKGLGHEARL